MSLDQLVSALREYATREHPGWDVLSLMVSRGVGAAPETIILTPTGERLSGPSLPAASRQ